jgi:cytoskeletal protein CcmA (bactofilin family)
MGDVFAVENVELAQKARITGDVYYNLIEMAMGAEVNGSLVHTKDMSKLPSKFAKKPAVANPINDNPELTSE